MAWTLARLGRDLDRALALARRAAGARPEDANVADTLATVHLARGEHGDAARIAGNALRGAAGPERGHLQYVRAAGLAGLGRRPEAREALAQALAEPASDPPAFWIASARDLASRLESAEPGAR